MIYLGFDIGGTEIKGAAVTERGNILKKWKRATPRGKNEILETVALGILFLKEEFSPIAVGIGTAGSVDTHRGRVTEISGNIPGWAHTDIKGPLERKTGLPVFVENDGNAALLGEMKWGNGRGGRNVAMLTLGTGLGGAFYMKDRGLLHGSHFKGMEVGHILLYPQGRSCFCGQKGCAERYVSGTAISLNYKDLTGKDLTGKEVAQLAGVDREAREALRLFARDLAFTIVSLKNLLDPDRVLLGGGVIKNRDLWWEDFSKVLFEELNERDSLEVLPGAFGNDAGILGGGALAMERRGDENEAGS